MFRQTEPAVSRNPLQNLKSAATSSFADIAITLARNASAICQQRRSFGSWIDMPLTQGMTHAISHVTRGA
jgi:hypothetical protein